ncbi:shock factor protein [Seminavis robusta]|uniref:Shock factor protein n=1 Tax=Seminavis robusta TaxID=568900 RepID=A0A9N8H4W1_9STRA|nr:shock factor protein [Seminavis robusta]|eukprot:Sro125_g060060.1 shock factor protein (389) ;mRNA; f:8521-9797
MSTNSNQEMPALAGNKRRSPTDELSDDLHYSGDEKVVQTTKSKGIVNVQLFIRKAFAMINECDPNIASWTDEGDKFVVKNKDVFAASVIPQYYDHSNYSSFTRQLNFYGFTREQSMTIKVSDLNSLAVGQETFYHQNFQRNRPDLLKNLQRKSSDNKNAKKRKKPRTDADVGYLQGRMESMEETTKEMLSTIKLMREENFASVAAIRDLQNVNAAKDEKIGALEKRIEWLERRLTSSAVQREESFLSAGQRLFGGAASQTKNAWATAAENVAHTFAQAQQQQQHTDNSYLTSAANGEVADATYSHSEAGATLARHPKMKRATAAPTKDIYAYDAAATMASIGNLNASTNTAPMRETSLDFGLFTGLARESSLLSWLPQARQGNNDKTL